MIFKTLFFISSFPFLQLFLFHDLPVCVRLGLKIEFSPVCLVARRITKSHDAGLEMHSEDQKGGNRGRAADPRYGSVRGT